MRGHNQPKRLMTTEERTLRIVGASAGHKDILSKEQGPITGRCRRPFQARSSEGSGDDVQMHILSGEGTLPERISVDGIGQALAMIDRAQQRSDTMTALRQVVATRHRWAGSNRLPALVTAPLPKLRSGVVPSAQASMLSRQAAWRRGLKRQWAIACWETPSAPTGSCGSPDVARRPVRSRTSTRSNSQTVWLLPFISLELRRSADWQTRGSCHLEPRCRERSRP